MNRLSSCPPPLGLVCGSLAGRTVALALISGRVPGRLGTLPAQQPSCLRPCGAASSQSCSCRWAQAGEQMAAVRAPAPSRMRVPLLPCPSPVAFQGLHGAESSGQARAGWLAGLRGREAVLSPLSLLQPTGLCVWKEDVGGKPKATLGLSFKGCSSRAPWVPGAGAMVSSVQWP